MERLWAPWRMTYIQQKKTAGCIFCDKPQENRDEENKILFRGEKNFVMLNTFPYNPGHLMVIPYRHISDPAELTKKELLEHYEIVRRSVKILHDVLRPEGFNIGMNLGKVAGAGIDDHIHTHIVPRWNGDTNFMPVLADTKVISEALQNTYNKLKGKF